MQQLIKSMDMSAFPPEVQARLQIADVTAMANVKKIERQIAQHVGRFSRNVNQILMSNQSTTEKIYALWAVHTEMSVFYAAEAACRVKCSHCCHIAVAMTPAEAEAVGKRIRRKPKSPQLVESFKGFDFGYHNPCPFLIKNKCSIYTDRPMACRTCFNMDQDSLLCQFGTGRDLRPVPYLDQLQIQMALIQIVQPTSQKCMADIRDYFPKRG